MGCADAPLLLDVRREETFRESRYLLAGARRCKPEDVASFAASQSPREVVVYCVYGHKLSAEVVATLRAADWNAHVLAGGMQGGEDGVDTPEDIAQWRAQHLPTVAKRSDLGVTGAQASRWITRERPKIDRIACPWLIRRFIDPNAVFLFVAPAEVVAVGERFNAIPFDIEDTFWSHRGELCTFDVMVEEFGLATRPLLRLATMVRAADTGRLDLSPEAPGLLAASLGLSRMYDDDLEQLEAGIVLYDAFYRWCRDASGETHNWPSAKAKP